MTSGNALRTYLIDHTAGSGATSDLAKRGADNYEGPVVPMNMNRPRGH